MSSWFIRERRQAAVISGPAGVGKTCLVVHWARCHQDDFQDGQLYIDLQGHGPDSPLEPADVLAAFLRGLGVADHEVPKPTHERASLYRSVLAGRRVLIVLDNAAGVDQVRPLLPGHDSCAVLVTSRDALAGLAVHDGAHLLDLGLLDSNQSVDLLRTLLGDRADREPAVADLVVRCAGLPLALRIVGQLALSRSSTSLAELSAELDDERDRLDVLEIGGDARSAVRSVFSWSYGRLPEESARAFRLFGAHPGRSIAAPAFATLCALPPTLAKRSLRTLMDAQLLAEHEAGRYSAHDLLRAYAAELCARGNQEEASAALVRVFDHYLHTADQADRRITSHRYRVALDGDAGRAVPLDDYASGMRWLDGNWRDAVALCRVAVAPELDTRRWQLAYTLRGYFYLTKQWDGWIASHESALSACRRLGDRHAEARIRNDLGLALVDCGRPKDAAVYYETAQRLFEEVGDRHGWAGAMANRAVLLRRSGKVQEALRLNAVALSHYLNVGARRNTAIAWRSRSKMHVELGALDEAAADLDRAMGVFTELGLGLDIAEARNLSGGIATRRGQPTQAEAQHLLALEASRGCGSRYEEADALRALGDLAVKRGAVGLARLRWREALALYRSMSSPKAKGISARLLEVDPDSS